MSQSGAPWTEEETNILLDIIWDNRHDGELEPAGQCLRFPNDGEIWRHASKALDENTGAQRTPRSCQSKWNTLQQMYGLVQQIRAKFGWDDVKGANIGPHNEAKWDSFISTTRRPKAALVYRDQGWPHLKSVHRLVVTPPHSIASSRTVLAPGTGNNASSSEQPLDTNTPTRASL
ncbi:hypothetical protein GALMADRAFT_877434 [Galerina marginata CBS 339.88]|uniref:Myb-like domain-containing protein n=1 Tax=Galerina marginata (strain CBS 339.88) TaxID=685588 RepID=A0A067TW92_GALM3|nr:hypothetical protein GALMADRAFT_877434 [Galerina marginata CBS 339.88]